VPKVNKTNRSKQKVRKSKQNSRFFLGIVASSQTIFLDPRTIWIKTISNLSNASLELLPNSP